MCLSSPKTPPAPEPPKPPAPPKATTAATSAAVEEQRKRTKKYTGQAASIMTGPLGLEGNAQTSAKKLMGQ